MFNCIKKYFKRQKSSPPPAPAPERIESAATRRPVQQYVYPPVANGIPRFSVAEILEEHENLIQRLRDLSENKTVFDARCRPVIERYATYVYLLPASEAHHHRGAGGLLCHGLETAKYVMYQSYDRLHGMQMSPQQRKAARERWLFAAFTSGISHDIGKPASNMRVFSVSGSVWDPYTQPLALWYQALPPQDDRIYVSWRRDGQDHRRTSVHLLNQVLLPEDLSYLQEIEPILLEHIYQAILGEKGVRNALPEMVQEADKKGLTLDLQKSNILSDLGPEVGQPLARHYVMTMRRLISDGKWQPNQPGGVLWVIGAGVYLVWPRMAEEITHLLHKDGTTGVPSNEFLLAEILEEHGLLALGPNGNRLWRLRPAAINVGEEGLLALRLKEPLYIMDLVPPSVPGEVREEMDEMPEAQPEENPVDRKKWQPIIVSDKSKNTQPCSDAPPAPEPPVYPGLSEEQEVPEDLQTAEGLYDYFNACGLGGQALLKFASEVSQGVRREGTDYKTGACLLLSWGEKKFIEENNLSEVIESLVRADWLRLNGIKRVHIDPGFGKCLKLRKRETILFWRLVRLLGESGTPEPGADASLPDGAPVGAIDAPPPEATPPQASPADSPPPEPPLTPQSEEKQIPAWVVEITDMLDRDGPVDYDLVEELVKKRTGRTRKITNLVGEYFLVNYWDGKIAVLSRKA